LVHISALSNRFVKDPHSVVKTGDVVKVKVMEIDLKRKRIALSMRLDDDATRSKSRNDSAARPAAKPAKKQFRPSAPAASKTGTLGDLLKDAMKRR